MPNARSSAEAVFPPTAPSRRVSRRNVDMPRVYSGQPTRRPRTGAAQPGGVRLPDAPTNTLARLLGVQPLDTRHRARALASDHPARRPAHVELGFPADAGHRGAPRDA